MSSDKKAALIVTLKIKYKFKNEYIKSIYEENKKGERKIYTVLLILLKLGLHI